MVFHLPSIERAVAQGYFGYAAVSIADLRAVVFIINQADDGRSPVVFAVEEDAVLVCLHKTVVCEMAEVGRNGGSDACLRTLVGVVALGVVAASGVSAAHEGDESISADRQLGGGEQAVLDGDGSHLISYEARAIVSITAAQPSMLIVAPVSTSPTKPDVEEEPL